MAEYNKEREREREIEREKYFLYYKCLSLSFVIMKINKRCRKNIMSPHTLPLNAIAIMHSSQK